MSPSPERVARIMLSWHALDLVSCTTIQTLWAGYGQICAITARSQTADAAKSVEQSCGVKSVSGTPGAGAEYPLILKLISPPASNSAQRNESEDEGHLRKMLSYEVEQYFYSDIVPHLGDDVAVAKCLASTRDMRGKEGEIEISWSMATVMVDLRPMYPVAGGKRSALNAVQVQGALDWLAGFHSRSWEVLPKGGLEGYVLPPLEESKRRRENGIKESQVDGLWLNGGYTYLATRRKEYASLVEDTDSEWSEFLCASTDGSSLSVAEKVALFLTPSGRPFESYIHGDVKSENLFTTTAGDKVAFFDFQYVGLGLGVCDLAKLFTCSVPLHMLLGEDDEEYVPEELTMRDGERKLLERYRSRLLQNQDSSCSYKWDEFKRHWETALVDWLRFQASWGFWGNTEWLEARVRSILADQGWRGWLEESIRGRC
ncbi:phosphotransferase enzyme family protein [Aspergillus stella-maris]|uniref:phosphotransferase enzyme family protein n=1 Tax=Aspergillus stella-maris TaxID=1810926 RepID=UPI003CCDE5AE